MRSATAFEVYIATNTIMSINLSAFDLDKIFMLPDIFYSGFAVRGNFILLYKITIPLPLRFSGCRTYYQKFMVLKRNRKILYLSTLLLCLFCEGCMTNNEKGKKEEHSVATIDLTKGIAEKKTIPLSKVSSSDTYIGLETKDESLLGKIEKLKIRGERIIILDDKKVVYIFDKNGKFKNKINKKGRGPGEYVNIMDFAYSPESGMLFLLDFALKKIFCFKENGENVYDIQLSEGGRPIGIEYFNGDLLLFYPYPLFPDNDYYAVRVIDLKGKTLHNLINKKERWEGFDKKKNSLTHFGYYIFHDTIVYWEEQGDDVYCIDGDYKVSVKWKLKNFHDIYKVRGIENDGQYFKNRFLVFNMQENNRYVFIRGYYGMPIKHANLLYEKENGSISSLVVGFDDEKNEKKFGYKCGFFNDIDGGWPFFPFGQESDGKLYCSFDPAEMVDLLITEKRMGDIFANNGNIALAKIIKSFSSVSNPVIMECE